MAPRARTAVDDPIPTVAVGPNPSAPSEASPAPKARRTRKSRGKTQEPTTEAVQALHGVVLVALSGAFTVAIGLNPAIEAFEPQSTEMDGIFLPLERIYLRHNQVPLMSPDTRDMIQAITAGAAYVGRIATTRVGTRRAHSGTTGAGSGRAGGSAAGNGHARNEPARAGNGGGPEAAMAELWADSYVPDANESPAGEGLS